MARHLNLNTSQIQAFTQADGVVVVENISWYYPCTQVSFSTDSTVGTLTVKAKYHPEADFETIYDEDGTTPLEIDLTNLKSFQLRDKWVHSLEFTPTGVDVSYTPLLTTGIMYQYSL